jgi:hypothetical protein
MPTLPAFLRNAALGRMIDRRMLAVLTQSAKALSSTFPVASTYPVVEDRAARAIWEIWLRRVTQATDTT